MLKRLFPKHYRQFTNSPAAPWLQGFAEWLVEQGYRRNPAHDHVSRLRRVLEPAGSLVPDMQFTTDEVAKLFVSLDEAISPTQQLLNRGTRRAFERFLESRGKLVRNAQAGRFDALLHRHARRLTDLCGFAPSTVSQHLATVSAFPDQSLPPDAPLSSLTREAVESFIVTTGTRIKRQSLQHIVARLRAFLRFCYECGEVARRLDAIDTPRTCRDELPPRALRWAQVLRLLRSIDRREAAGCRDHAMLYLMSHYGLRPSEIAALTLDSIDWTGRTLKVAQCKTRSTLVLPLSDSTLRVLKRYLRCGRRGGRHRQLFLRNRSPEGPITHYTVCDVYQKRSRQSGLPLGGTSAYCLRHTFAMRLLERGVGVKTIGDLLGHRSLESTCAYLRLQVDALRDIALPLHENARRVP